MSKSFKDKVSDLAKDLKFEIQRLEAELSETQQMLSALTGMESKPARKKRGGRPAVKAVTAKAAPKNGRRTKGNKPGRRKSKNRDIILEAASKLGPKFSMAELIQKIQEKEPKFGGDYASGTIISVLKSTPEIKKVKRGVYRYKG